MKLKPWQLIGIPCGIIAFVFFGLAFTAHDGSWAKFGILPFLILAVAYILSPQINWWWYKRNPPPLDIKLQRILDDYFLFYKKLNPELKKRFRDRTALYLLGNDFIRPVHPDDPDATANRKLVPEDIKAAVAAMSAQLSFGKEDFLTGKFENIIIYPHPFPTPQYGDIFHTSEIYEPDGVILFSSDILMAGFNNPQGYFSIGLYEFAKIFKIMYPSVSYPVLDENIWSDFEKIGGKSRSFIESTVGLEQLDTWGVAVYHFFTFPEKFQKVLPDLYQLLSNIFNQNPANEGHPVLSY
jgi:Mlc titration factor MtfA (ptsG expression regulator)